MCVWASPLVPGFAGCNHQDQKEQIEQPGHRQNGKHGDGRVSVAAGLQDETDSENPTCAAEEREPQPYVDDETEPSARPMMK